HFKACLYQFFLKSLLKFKIPLSLKKWSDNHLKQLESDRMINKNFIQEVMVAKDREAQLLVQSFLV
ncbi:hypothetical protein KK470_29560, partial [Klebsiella pneumoniae]|uniref:hypothetical protein n=1 Tax=Klebsiella pneumoniae TaxID=573 RepID=UPI001BDFF530